MLTPEYLTRMTDQLLGLYDILETDIVCDVARRIAKSGTLTSSAAEEIKRAQQYGAAYDDIVKDVAKATSRSDAEVRSMFMDAGVRSYQFDAAAALEAGLDVSLKLSPAAKRVLEAVIKNTQSDLSNLSLTTADQAQQSLIQAINEAIMKVQSGAFDYTTAIRDAVKQVAYDGTLVSYPSGHTDRLDTAIRRAVLTAVNKTVSTLTEDFSDENDVGYYETSAHAGARPTHAVWQGKVFQRTGRSFKYPNFYEETGYGEPDGICGINCRHSFYPFWPGLSKRAFDREKLDEFNRKTVTYDGSKMSYYDATQKQRSYERSIRQTKRELAGYKAAAEASPDSSTEAAMNEAFTKAAVKLKDQRSRLSDFCDQTGLIKQNARTQVYDANVKDGVVKGYDRSIAQKAVWAARKAGA